MLAQRRCDVVQYYHAIRGSGALMKTNRVPNIGVGVIVLRDGLVLLGERIGSHGARTWAFPGGHLEFGESVEQCAKREVFEEAGLKLGQISEGPFTNDVFVAEGKHYVTLFVVAHGVKDKPRVLEPTKCARWSWFRWSAFPEPLFLPVQSLRSTGFVPEGAA